MKIDYKLVDPPRKRSHPLRWLMILLLGAPAVVALALVNDSTAPESAVRDTAVILSESRLPPVQIQLVGQSSPPHSEVALVATADPAPSHEEFIQHLDAPAAAASIEPEAAVAELTVPEAVIEELPEPAIAEEAWESVTVSSGDSLTRIFSRLGLNARVVYDVLALGEPTAVLKNIHPGQILRLRVDDGELLALEYDINAFQRLRVDQKDGELGAETIEFDKDIRIARAAGIIEDSLYLAGNRAGLSDKLIMSLVEIFGWDINFWLDIRKGDQFAVIYEEVLRDGEKIRDGRILAAEFVNRDVSHRAVYYADNGARGGYYDPNGHPMRKTFLRSPIKNAPVTSGFTLSRYHPVLKTWRAHRGVDYGASTGTPIRSTADGTITKLGWSNGYGKVVTIQHAGRYSTLYAHMSRFAPKLKEGSRVSQGQVIGYVGKTGLATGPHLHFEFRIDGKHHDPQKVKFPKAKPLPEAQLAAFNEASKSWFKQLDSIDANMVAMNDRTN
ncbi:MAG: peptidoglycan DD-metalloendopeptidase family protein [Gammaproteobacteria bacterium]|nr:peptidoglycan DD-metalloendopeptidase family protein [Gammaproteobacteria bacterium]